MKKLGPHGLKIFAKTLARNLDSGDANTLGRLMKGWLKESSDAVKETMKKKVGKKDDLYGKKYAQIYKKGGSVKPKKFGIGGGVGKAIIAYGAKKAAPQIRTWLEKNPMKPTKSGANVYYSKDEVDDIMKNIPSLLGLKKGTLDFSPSASPKKRSDNLYGRQYAQIYKKGGLVSKKTFIARGCGKVMDNRRKKTKIY